MKIPLVDLNAQHNSIKVEMNEAIQRVIEASEFIGGKERNEFEKSFAAYCGKEHCIGASNGSTALYAVLKCLGIKDGDEVIMPVNTFIATAFAATLCGAKPVFVDVNDKDFLIDTELIESKINSKTKAIIPVHLYGNVCDMDKIKEIANKHNLIIVEDCAQAHGSKYKEKMVPITDIGCFSFFPAKNLGALGDSGAIVLSSARADLAKKCKMFVNHGRTDKYLHEMEGFNFRMNNLQAAVLNVKLAKLDQWRAKKQQIAANYDDKLKDKVITPEMDSNIEHSYYMYVIRSRNRDKLMDAMKIQGIETGIHYPVPLHLQPAFSYLGYKEGDFPIAEKHAKEILSIPIYPELSQEQIDKVVNNILSN